MGKIRIKTLGADEEAQKKQDQLRREQKKEKKLAKLKGKGGGRIIDMTAEEPVVKPEILAVKEPKKVKKKVVHQRGKKILAKRKLVDRKKLYSIEEAVSLVKKTSYSRFVGSVEAHINTRQKGLRGEVVLPYGTGKKIRVAIADEEVLTKVKENKIDFDILIAHPSFMPKLATVARILGPKGLMPNPKAGTISTEPEQTAKKFTQGQIQWKTESAAPIVHCVIGKVDFSEDKLAKNLATLIKAIGPGNINSVFIKATMGPSIKVKAA